MRYRDKIPKPMLEDLTWRTQAPFPINPNVTTVENVVEYFRGTSLSNARKVADPSLRPSLRPLVSPGFNFEHPFSPIASSYHSPILGVNGNASPNAEMGALTGKAIDSGKLEKQELTHDNAEPSLLSSLESVSYLVDLVVFPIKFVWRMAYGR